MVKSNKITLKQNERANAFRNSVQSAEAQLFLAQKLLIRRAPIQNALPAIRLGFHHVQKALQCLAGTDLSLDDLDVDEKRLGYVTPLTEDDFAKLEQMYQQYLSEGTATFKRRVAKRYIKALSQSVHSLLEWKKRNAREDTCAIHRILFSVKYAPITILVLIGLLSLSTVVAKETPPSKTGLSATYYKDTHFKKKHRKRIEKVVNHDWKQGSPIKGLNKDNFSVRWMGTVIIREDEERVFSAGADDTVRLYIDDELIIDNPGPQKFRSKKSDIAIGPGEHKIRVDYVEHKGVAKINLSWSTPNGYWSEVPTYRLRPSIPPRRKRKSR